MRTTCEREARKQMSQLRVTKSYRSYNDKMRTLPGAIFEYHGQQYVLGGQQNNGIYYYPYGTKTLMPSKDCKFTKINYGLVFLD